MSKLSSGGNWKEIFIQDYTFRRVLPKCVESLWQVMIFVFWAVFRVWCWYVKTKFFLYIYFCVLNFSLSFSFLSFKSLGKCWIQSRFMQKGGVFIFCFFVFFCSFRKTFGIFGCFCSVQSSGSRNIWSKWVVFFDKIYDTEFEFSIFKHFSKFSYQSMFWGCNNMAKHFSIFVFIWMSFFFYSFLLRIKFLVSVLESWKLDNWASTHFSEMETEGKKINFVGR